MSTIDELNNEILTLRKKNDPWEEKLLALVQQSTEHLTAKQKRRLDDEIKSVRTTISENNQIILQKEKQITARERQIAADKETNKNQITEKAKQITADKEKDAAIAKFRAERVSWRANFLSSSFIAFVWSVFETYGVPYFISVLKKYGRLYLNWSWSVKFWSWSVKCWNWSVQFKATNPNRYALLYLLIHLGATCTFASCGLVEFFAKLVLGLWSRNEIKGNPIVGTAEEQVPLAAPDP